MRNANTRAKLAAASKYATPCDRAALVLAFCMRTQGRFPVMRAQDMGACVENALVQIAAMDLGAVWMGIYPEKERMAAVSAALELPNDIEPFALVAIGHPAQPVEAKGASRFDEARIHEESR